MAKILKSKLGNFLVICLIFLIVTGWIFSGWPRIWHNPLVPPEVKEVKATPGKTIEQQINIIDQEYETGSGSYVPTDHSLGIVEFDPTKYNGESLYFEALIGVCDGLEECDVTTYERIRSGSITLPGTAQQYTVHILNEDTGVPCAGDNYHKARVELYSLTSSAQVTSVLGNNQACPGEVPGTTEAGVKAARLIIVQSDATNITNTETQIEIGNNENTTQTSYTDLTDKKIYLFDADKFNPAPSAYFEATLKSSIFYSTVTYYFNAHSATEVWTNPDNMTDGDKLTYATTSTDNQVQLNNASSYPGDRTETITKVEVRVFGNNETGNNGEVWLRPVFGGTVVGTNHIWTPPERVDSGVGNSPYFDITSDTNAPSPWTWTDVQNLDMDVEMNKVGGPDTVYVSRVEIRVTYEAGAGTAYAQLYNKTDGVAVGNSQVSVNSTSWTRVRGANPLSTNWDTTNDDEYYVQIQTSVAGSTAYIANAKIILTQSNAGGIDKLETVQQYVNKGTTLTTQAWTSQDFDNECNPGNWDGGTFVYYFEATIKRSSAGGVSDEAQARLDYSSLQTESIVGEIISAYNKRRSSQLTGSNMPSVATNMDTQLYFTGTATSATVSTSWLIIQVSGLAVTAPSLSFSISDNSIGFGSLNTSAPRFATGTDGSDSETSAHDLDVSISNASGYSITVKGATLTFNSYTIDAIGGTATDVSIGGGTEQFGIRLTVSGGGSVVAPYNGVANMYAYAATATTEDEVASFSGSSDTSTFSVFYAANISTSTEAGSYTSALTYICTGNF